MNEIKEFIEKKTNYLLSLNTKDKLVLGQLLGLKCVLEYIKTLEEEKEKGKVRWVNEIRSRNVCKN